MIAWLPGITFALRLGPHDSSLVETMQYFLAAALMLGMLSGNSALSQEAEGVANYAYAIFFGTGKYSVSDRNIYVLRAPLVFTLGEPDYAHYCDFTFHADATITFPQTVYMRFAMFEKQ